MRTSSLWTTLVFGIAGLAVGACSKSTPREWRASDHDQAEPPPSQPAPVSADSDDVWTRSCTSCHGPDGSGTTPTGRSLRVRNLTDPVWQGRASDADIAAVIREGRGNMPKFDLPPERVESLVRKIRSFKK